jgi:hypothetical protein
MKLPKVYLRDLIIDLNSSHAASSGGFKFKYKIQNIKHFFKFELHEFINISH